MRLFGVSLLFVISAVFGRDVCDLANNQPPPITIVSPYAGSEVLAYETGIVKLVVEVEGRLMHEISPELIVALDDDPTPLPASLEPIQTCLYLKCSPGRSHTITVALASNTSVVDVSTFTVTLVSNPFPDTDTAVIPIQKPQLRGRSGCGRRESDWSQPFVRLRQLYEEFNEDVKLFRRQLREVAMMPHFLPLSLNVAGLRTHVHDPELEIMYLRIRDLQPRHVAEIGSFCGWSAAAWLIAMEHNGFGQLYAFEPDECASFVSSLPFARGHFTFFNKPMEFFFEEGTASPDFDYYFLDGPHSGEFALRYVKGILEKIRVGESTPVQVHDSHNVEEGRILADWIMLGGRAKNVFSIEPLRSPAAFNAFQKIRMDAGIPIEEDVSHARATFTHNVLEYASTTPPFTGSPSVFFEVMPTPQVLDYDPVQTADAPQFDYTLQYR